MCDFDIEAIRYLVNDDEFEDLTSLMGVLLPKWGVNPKHNRYFFAAIFLLAGHHKEAKKLDPGIDGVPAAVSALTTSIDDDQDLIDNLKMKSILIILQNQLSDDNDLQNKFIAELCYRLDLRYKDYKGLSLFKLFKKMENMTELAFDNMTHIEEVLQSDDDFKSTYKEYCKYDSIN